MIMIIVIIVLIIVITLWWTYKKLLKMAIEIVDFPSYKMVNFHGKMLVHQRVMIND